MEVIHEGVIEIGLRPDSKSAKDWKTRLFVLKHYLQSERATLDYYKNTNKRWQKQSIKGVLSLWPHFELSIAHLCSYKFTLKLITTEHTVYLAAPTAAAMNKWYYFLQTQQLLTPTNDMYIFSVQARDSDSMNLIGAVGDCQLVFTHEYQVMVVKLPKKEVLCIWPFDCLKNFSYGGGLFSFTSGRHAPHGPGDYSFITCQDKLIHHTLHKRIERARRNSTVSSGSSSMNLSISDRPPAKLPLFNMEESSSDTPTSSSDDNHAVLDNMYSASDDSPSHPPPLPNQPPPKILPKGTKSWLHERYGASSLEPENHQSVDDLGETEDHVYSHTIHRGYSQKPAVEDDPAIYNALVHQGSIKRPSQNYDVAYPKAKSQSIKGGDTYSVIGQDNSKDVVDTPLSPLCPDGMTANPLYGSSGNLLDAIVSSDSAAKPLPHNDTVATPLPLNDKPLPPSDPVVKPLPPSDPVAKPLPPSDPVAKPLPSSDPVVKPLPPSDPVAEPLPPSDNPLPPCNSDDTVVTKPPTRPDVTANPVYVTTSINSSSSSKPVPPPQQATPTSDQVQERHGYTKITKPAKEEEVPEVPSSVGSDPPPIPDRVYSFSDFENTSLS